MIRTPLKRKRSKPRRGVLKDPEYLAWIREQPCMLCVASYEFTKLVAPELFAQNLRLGLQRQQTKTEAAHVGTRGLGQKCSDRETLPLCGSEHHRLGPYSHHKLGKRFAEFHGIDIRSAIAQYNMAYERWRNGGNQVGTHD